MISSERDIRIDQNKVCGFLGLVLFYKYFTLEGNIS